MVLKLREYHIKKSEGITKTTNPWISWQIVRIPPRHLFQKSRLCLPLVSFSVGEMVLAEAAGALTCWSSLFRHDNFGWWSDR